MKRYLRKITAASNKADKFIPTIHKKIEDKLYQVMQSPEFGFTADEAKEYSIVEVRKADDVVIVEVRAELGYDGMMKLSEALDPIVEPYGGAYFDMDSPGIMEAYIPISAIE